MKTSEDDLQSHGTFLLDCVNQFSCHHHPQQAQQAKRATAIVHLADFLVRAVGHGSGGDPWVSDLNHKAWDRLGLSIQDLEETIVDFCDELEFLESEELL